MREVRLYGGSQREYTQTLELRAHDGGGHTLSGYAAVFDAPSQNLGGFVERIAPGAFAKTVQEADVRHLLNHDPSAVLGRNRAGTLRLSEDRVGLRYEVDLPDTQTGRDLAALVERGDITGSSFGFRVVGEDGDEWSLTEDGFPLRTLRQVALSDTSTVTYPAYLSTEDDDVKAAVRSLAVRLDRPVDELVDAARANELRSLMLPEDGGDVGPSDPHPESRIAVYRSKLDTLADDPKVDAAVRLVGAA